MVSGDNRPSVNVVGLGYVGAELCLAAIEAGYRVSGIDSDAARLSSLFEAATDTHDEWRSLREVCQDGRLSVYHSAIAAPSAEVWIVAVPTPLDAVGKPDVSNIAEAANAIASVVGSGATVVLESTSYPGTTEDVFLPPFLEAGLTPGVEIFIGYSPERINPGGSWTMRSIPKLVSGRTSECRNAIERFYSTIVNSVHTMSSIRAAELAKLYENSWRLINIAFANEIEALCIATGIDPWEVAEACATKPFGFLGFTPGPGAGGHCIPVDSAYLSSYASAEHVDMPLLDAALVANRKRPGEIARRVQQRVPPGEIPHVLLVGIAYKPNVADIRESAALIVMRHLEELGMEVEFHDPLVGSVQTSSGLRYSVSLSEEGLLRYDCVVVLCAHSTIQWNLIQQTNVHVMDLSNARWKNRANQLVAGPSAAEARGS